MTFMAFIVCVICTAVEVALFAATRDPIVLGTLAFCAMLAVYEGVLAVNERSR